MSRPSAFLGEMAVGLVREESILADLFESILPSLLALLPQEADDAVLIETTGEPLFAVLVLRGDELYRVSVDGTPELPTVSAQRLTLPSGDVSVHVRDALRSTERAARSGRPITTWTRSRTWTIEVANANGAPIEFVTEVDIAEREDGQDLELLQADLPPLERFGRTLAAALGWTAMSEDRGRDLVQ